MVQHYLCRLGLSSLVDRLVPRRGRSQLTHGEAIAVLVANRLCASAPLYDIAGWASSAAIAELLGVPAMLLNDARLDRALEALAPVVEEVRGQLMVNTVRELPALVDASRLHLDLSAVRFAGAYEGSALVKKGWAADLTIARKVKTLQASTKAGVAVYFRPHEGSSSERRHLWLRSRCSPRHCLRAWSSWPTRGSAIWRTSVPRTRSTWASWCCFGPTPAGRSGSAPMFGPASRLVRCHSLLHCPRDGQVVLWRAPDPPAFTGDDVADQPDAPL